MGRPRGAHSSIHPPILHDGNVPAGRVERDGNLFSEPRVPNIYRCQKCGCLFTEDP